jgi:hypothetical protein
LREVIATDATHVAPFGASEPSVTLRLPRGVRVRAGSRFSTLRGVLVERSALGDSSQGLELWVGAAEDVVLE